MMEYPGSLTKGELVVTVKDYIEIMKIVNSAMGGSALRKKEKNLKKGFDYDALVKQKNIFDTQKNLGMLTEKQYVEKLEQLNKRIEEYNLVSEESLEKL